MNAFIAGGWGMYPTLLSGLVLLAACVQYARRPESRYVPLLLALGLLTLLFGALGFVASLIAIFQYVGDMQAGAGAPLTVTAAAMGEALYNVALALLLTTLSALPAAVGAWKLARQPQAAAALAASR